MLKTTIVASYIDGTERELPGYSIAPGLAVHRAVTMTGDETNDWNIVHIPSGFRVCGSFPTRKQAVQAATEFAKLADWTRAWNSGEFQRVGLVGQLLGIRSRILYSGPLFRPSLTGMPEQNQGRLFT
jgi:hypothetical protein